MAAIEGYASVTSAAPNDVVDFHVRADAAHSHFAMEIYRRGLADELVKTYEGDAFVPGAQDDAALVASGCDWPPAAACRTVIPPEWNSGYYVAKLSSNGEEAWVPFVVRTAAPATNAKILAKISDTTSQAYNAWGGRSFYSSPFAPRISFDRPYDDLTLYEKYQLPFLRWVEQHGYGVDYCSSLDLHANPLQLEHYRLFLSLGHDEYWSLEMRDQVEAFIASGGNVCFFSANTCFWQIRFDSGNGGRIMICYKEAEPGHPPDPDRQDSRRVTTQWSKAPVLRPENSMTGVSYRNGAGWWVDPVDPVRRYRGYTVTGASHWVFGGTGVSDGDQFGAGESVDTTILGYETDATGGGTPENFVVLARADLTDWTSNGQGGYATMGIYRRNGIAFTAATVNWAAGLNQNGAASTVDRITQNLIEQLSLEQLPVIELGNTGFEDWDNGLPAGWALDGAGTVSPEDTDPDASSNNMRFSGGGGDVSLKVDASAGQTWITQSDFACDASTTYAAGCWARADAPGASIRLQTTDTWTDFAIAQHSGSGRWEYLFATGSPGDAAASFPARVKIQVAAGVQAWFDDVIVMKTP
ncbi:MAG: N,N-dimethylformamidase beta subunit family domain-containing protein [Vulcanimicrobiaceae bacterium]